ncbi:MAG: HD domain-containing protein [Chloroflexota bacterium]|nr:HD domain-containing protein [Chloroflexota bacterium]MDQ5865908.1 HD domain-containing protein [Chloroflexota bacterium]
MFGWLKNKLNSQTELVPEAPEPTVREALLSERPSDTFARWADEGVLGSLMSDLNYLRKVPQLPAHRDNAFIHTLKVVDAIEPTPVRRWAALMHDIGKGPTYIATPEGRSRFFEHDLVGAVMAVEIMSEHGEAPETIEAVERLVRLHMRPISYRVDWTDAAVRRLVEEAEEVRGRAGWDDLMSLAHADLRGYLPEPIDRGLWVLQTLEERRRHMDEAEAQEAQQAQLEPRSPLDGTELLALGNREPGPWVGQLKNFLCSEVEAGRLPDDDKATAAELARHWLEAHGPRIDTPPRAT